MRRLFLCFSIVLNLAACQDPGKHAEVSQKNRRLVLDQGNVEPLDYEVIERKDISYAGKPRMAYRVVLNAGELPSEAEMRRTAEAIWGDGNKHWSEFTIFMYMRGMDTEGASYVVAEFRASRLADFKIQDFALYGTKWRSLEEEGKQADDKWAVGKQMEKVKEYTVDLGVTKTGPRQIEIGVDTNFPNGTNLLVSVSRTYYQKAKSDPYAGEILSRDVAVTNGKINLIVNVDDRGWYSEFQGKKNQFEGLGVFSDIERISPEVEVGVMFSPKRHQPSRVLGLLGRNAENVKGKGAKRTGSFTTYSVSKNVGIPFKK